MTINGVSQLDDRVADELTWPVPGDLAAPVDIDHRRPWIARRPVERAGPAACRVDRLVLEQQAAVGDLVAGPQLVQVPLQGKCLLVGHCIGTEAGAKED